MVEVIGDIVAPSEFLAPPRTTAQADALSAANILSGAVWFNTDLGKLEVKTATDIETITSVAR